MIYLDNTSVSKECAMVCTDIHYEDWDEDIIMYGDQGVSTEEHNEATYMELTKTESEEEQEVKLTWPYVLMIVCHLRKNKGDLTKTHLTKMCTT